MVKAGEDELTHAKQSENMYGEIGRCTVIVDGG